VQRVVGVRKGKLKVELYVCVWGSSIQQYSRCHLAVVGTTITAGWGVLMYSGKSIGGNEASKSDSGGAVVIYVPVNYCVSSVVKISM